MSSHARSPQVAGGLSSDLLEAAEQHRLVILCGAGLSMAPPSLLPSWAEFNQAILDEIQSATRDLLRAMSPATLDAVNTLAFEDALLPVHVFSDYVVRSFAGDSYFPVLSILDSDKPNPNHRALAELARRGALRAIISTNFDTLIERAFLEAAVPLSVVASADDLYSARAVAGTCTLYKIHGSVREAMTLVDTVSQKLRGLPPGFRRALRRLYVDTHLLVLGFSGADLAFDEDYLALKSASPDQFEITWLVRPGETLLPRVQDLLTRFGSRAATVAAALPAFFEEFDLELALPSDSDPTGDRKATAALVRSRVHEWLISSPHIGSIACAVLCSYLLDVIGKTQDARSIRQQLAALPDISGPEVPLNGSIAFRCLALGAIQDGNADQGIFWSSRELAYAEAFAREGQHVSDDRCREWSVNRAGAWLNLSVAARLKQDFELARNALMHARQAAEEAGTTHLISLVYVGLAHVAEHDSAGPEKVLELARTAQALGIASGSAVAIADAQYQEATTFVALAEYDNALAAIESARAHAHLGKGADARVRLSALEAEIAFRRGNIADGREGFLSVISEAERAGFALTAPTIRWQYVKALSLYSTLWEEALDQLDVLLRDLPEPLDKMLQPDFLAGLRDRLERSVGRGVPSVLEPRQEPSDSERKVRKVIEVLEFQQHLDNLPACFECLAREKYSTSSPARMLDAATSFLSAARRAGKHEMILSALNKIGIAHDLLGNLTEARSSYESALSANPPPEVGLRGQIELHLAYIHSKLGNISNAFRLYDAAIVSLSSAGDVENTLRARFGLARYLAAQGKFHRAIKGVEWILDHADEVRDPRIRPTVTAALMRWKAESSANRSAADSDATVLSRDSSGLHGITSEDLPRLRDLVVTPADRANLGMVEYDLGYVESAYQHIQAAQAGYEEVQDRLGIARCLSNLASFATRERRFDDSLDLYRKSLAIREELLDIPGQILVRSNLASLHYEIGDSESALGQATRCIELGQGRPYSRPIVVAWMVLFDVALEHGKVADAEEAGRHIQEGLATIEEPDLDARWLRTNWVASTADRDQEVRAKNPSEFEAGRAEAARLGRLGRLQESLEILDGLTASFPSPRERAYIEGTRGNAYQTAGAHTEAIEAYDRAAELFQYAEECNSAAQARQSQAVSLRKIGRSEEARTVLEQVLTEDVTGQVRAQTLSSLANTIAPFDVGLMDEQIVVDDKEILPPPHKARAITEARALLSEARALSGLDDEIIGIIELTDSRLALGQGAVDESLERLHVARRHLLRCNSQHLAMCESQIGLLEDFQSRAGR